LLPQNIKIKGAGIGLRAKHFDTLLKKHPAIGWLEVVADQFLFSDGIILDKLQELRRHYPVVLHCLGCSVGSTDPLNTFYLDAVKQLATTIQPAWISDHCCWVSHRGDYVFDLLPLPYNAQTMRHVAQRAGQIQDYLGHPFALENVSAYVDYNDSTMSEAAFLQTVADKADIGILLDVNNVYVSGTNQQKDPHHYFDQIDPTRVLQMHLAGFEEQNALLIDTHGRDIQPPVWTLYQEAIDHFGAIPTSLEWDRNIPDWETYIAQAALIEQIIPQRKSTKDYHPSTIPSAESNFSLSVFQDTLFPAYRYGHHEPALAYLAHNPDDAKQRLQIYTNSIIGSIVNAYRKIFQAAWHLVGTEYMRDLITAYAMDTYMPSPDITDSAAGLADYTQSHTPSQQQIPYLADFLAFEWCWHQCFHQASGSTPIRLQSQYPLAELWSMCQPEYQDTIQWPKQTEGEYEFAFVNDQGNVLVYDCKEPTL